MYVGQREGRERESELKQKTTTLCANTHRCTCTCTSPYSPSIQMRADFPSGSVTSSKEVGSWGMIDSTMFSNLRRISMDTTHNMRYINSCNVVYVSLKLPYSGNISREKNFAKASTHVLHENFAGFYFANAVKVTTSTM